MKARIDDIENMSPQFSTKRRETFIVKIAIDRARQAPPPGMGRLSRTVRGGSALNKNSTNFLFEKSHVHFFIFQY
jgi:hypothetical protein